MMVRDETVWRIVRSSKPGSRRKGEAYTLPCCRRKKVQVPMGVRSGPSWLCRGRRIEGGGSIVESRSNGASLRGIEGTGSTDSGSCFLHKRSCRSRSRITTRLRADEPNRGAQLKENL